MSRALGLLLLLALVCFSGLAGAAPKIRLIAEKDAPGIELRGAAREYSGRFTILNTGTEAVEISKLEVRTGGEYAPHVPRETKVEMEAGRTRIAPGAKAEAVVRYAPKRESRVRRFRGHVLVAAAGDPEPQAIGIAFNAHRLEGDPLRHFPFALILIPLVVAIGLLLVRKKLPPDAARKVVGAGALGSLALSLACAVRMDPALSRYDGGQGFHWLERTILIPRASIEIAYGLDGLSVTFAILIPLLVLASAALGRRETRTAIWAALALVQAALSMIIVGQDVATVSMGWVALAGASAWLCRVHGLGRAGAVAAGAPLVTAAGLWLLALSSKGLLLDGTAVTRVTSFMELPYVIDHGVLAGGHPARIVVPLLLIGLLPLLGVPLLGGYAKPLAQRASLPVQIVLLAAVSATAGYGLVRFLVGLVPAGLIWSSKTLVALGIAGALLAALSAVSRKDHRGLVLSLGGISASLTLVALGSLTGAAVQAALLLVVARTLSVVAVLSAASLAQTEQTGDAEVPTADPVLLGCTVVGLAGASGAPATVGFIALAQTVIATMPLRTWAVPLIVAAVILGAGAGFAAIQRALSAAKEGERDRVSLGESERATILALGVLILVLGFAPRLWLYRIDSSSLDHADKLNPPGLLEVVRAPTCTRTPSHFS